MFDCSNSRPPLTMVVFLLTKHGGKICQDLELLHLFPLVEHWPQAAHSPVRLQTLTGWAIY